MFFIAIAKLIINIEFSFFQNKTLLIVFLISIISFHISSSLPHDKKKKIVNDQDNDEDREVIHCFVEPDQSLNENALSLGPQDITRILIEGSHSFSFDLVKALSKFELKEASPGILVSPSSIWSSLIITYLGANGDTDSEIKSVLRIKKLSKTAVARAVQGLKFWGDLKKNMSKSNQLSEKSTYSLANKIFFNDDLRLNECIEGFFNGDVEKMDFTNKPSESIERINNWVKDQTQGKIVDLIPNGAINPWSKMILANAVYFNSKWMNQFQKENTKLQTFYISPTDEIQVEMMTQTGTFMYGISERLQVTALEMSYANPDYSMIILLPEPSRGLDTLIRTIKPNDLYELVSNMYDDEIFVSLPKFKIEQHFELAGPLYSMGIRKLFDPRFVDLSGFFANLNDTKQPIAVNSVIHKTFINVDEEGTEAAAASALMFGRSGRPVFPTQFIANRPFMYLIRDTQTNFILFMGTVKRPQS